MTRTRGTQIPGRGKTETLGCAPPGAGAFLGLLRGWGPTWSRQASNSGGNGIKQIPKRRIQRSKGFEHSYGDSFSSPAAHSGSSDLGLKPLKTEQNILETIGAGKD